MFKFSKDENGNILVLVAFLIAVFCAVGGIAVDLGLKYTAYGKMQKAADSAALAAAKVMTQNGITDVHNPTVQNTINDIIAKNDVGSATTPSISVASYGGNGIKVTVDGDVPTFFMKALGVSTMHDNAKAAAKYEAVTSKYGAVPLGITDDTRLITGHSYVVKDDCVITNGWFGYLDLGQWPSARATADFIINGSNRTLKVGDVIGTATGNMSSITNSSINVDNAVIVIYNRSTMKVTGFALCSIQADRTQRAWIATFKKTVSVSTGSVMDSQIQKAVLTE